MSDEDDSAEMRRRQEVVAETATIRAAETRDGFIVSWNSVDLFVSNESMITLLFEQRSRAKTESDK